jgi:hypothetical protein
MKARDSDEEAAAFEVQDCAGCVVGFAEEDYGARYVLGRTHLFCRGALDQARYFGVVVILGRHHHAECDAVDLHFGGEFLGQRLGETYQAALRYGVRQVIFVGADAGPIAEVDDFSGALPAHRSAGELRQEEWRLEVDVEVRVPVALGDFLERLGCEDRGRVDEDVDLAEGVEHVGDQLFDFGDAVEVGAECPRLAALGRDPGDDCFGLGAGAMIMNCDRRAVVGELYRDGASDAAARACHQRNFSFEVHAEVCAIKIEATARALVT